MKKIERLLAIVMALKQNGKMTASDIASLLEVNVRTIYRDIDALSQMEVPLVSLPGKEGGYEILDDYFIPSISFTGDEILALSIARDLILNTEIPGFDPFIHSAFLKITNIIPGKDIPVIRKITGRILFDMKYIDPEMEGKDYFPLIRESFEKDLCLHVGYYSSRLNEVKERLVKPHILTFSDGVWYLRGKSEDKPFLWWFRLDRIKYLRLSDAHFYLPEDFDKREYLYSQNTRGEYSVRLSMSISLYETVKDDVLFKNGHSERSGDEILVAFETDRKEHVLEFLFRNCDSARLIEPAALVSELKEKLEKMGKSYK